MKLQGWLGLLFVALAQANFFFKFQPFADWYFPIIWIGYILLVDGLMKESKLLTRKTLCLFGLSIPFWFVYEFFNGYIQNWYYNPEFGFLARLLSAMFITPAIYITYEFISSKKLFSKVKLKSCKCSKLIWHLMIPAGIICTILPLYFPKYAFPLVWIALFLIFEPVNRTLKMHTISQELISGKLSHAISLGLAGVVVGFFWEFWNYWAIPKWFYTIPFVDFLRIFEMPLLGYLGYIPFAFSIYALWQFAFGIMKKLKIRI